MLVFTVNGSDVFHMDEKRGVTLDDVKRKAVEIAQEEEVDLWEVDMRFSGYEEN
jgi:hypothetical protein